MGRQEIVFVDFTIGGIATTISHFLGGWSFALETLLIFIVFDYVTGVLKALYKKELSSEAGLKGIIRKIGYLIIVALAFRIDKMLGSSGALYTLVVYFFVANEGVSIVENWVGMDLPMPKALKNALAQLKGEEANKKSKNHSKKRKEG